MSCPPRLTLALLAIAGAPCAAHADQLVSLTVQNHTFTPSSFTVPAGERFRIQLTNNDDTVDEFESYDMKFEKIVVPGNTITVFAGPMHPGTYSFFDDYHPDQAKGTVTVVAAKE
ncbi:cupredoxin domain-containing protein [Pseudomonas sp. MAFF 301514]|uniref:Cupredoxin domain-containing protein n=1 Tax=Pseudomonas allii TaxID=2740531 RepID=A0A7Y8UX00_9PSED|nr:cupredoxin domain-containing protein [Pseudomonas allii]NWN51304.1 cupredoxin domain-containing protein [Pseudomonas allii]NWN61598.1 cupredoxin domain-containing protein [Pseudomonas allii]